MRTVLRSEGGSEGERDPWTSAMRRGDFATAWQVCDRVLQQRLARQECCHHWPRHLQFIWKGQPLDHQRVLVRCYHGLGDTLQFVRLAASLRPRLRALILWVQPALLELLRGVAGVDQLLPLHDGMPDVDYDADIEIMELAHVLRVSSADLPLRIPYLRVAEISEITPLEPGCYNVGLAWRSGAWNSQRSIPMELLGALAHIPSVRWYSLQYECAPPPFAIDIACSDLRQLAARMQTLDLVISVDTMTAHLAGALGLNTWALLSQPCDWRWMTQRDDSPWYPTMRLFRQQRLGDWNSVIEAVIPALRQAATGRAQRLCS